MRCEAQASPDSVTRRAAAAGRSGRWDMPFGSFIVRDPPFARAAVVGPRNIMPAKKNDFLSQSAFRSPVAEEHRVLAGPQDRYLAQLRRGYAPAIRRGRAPPSRATWR